MPVVDVVSFLGLADAAELFAIFGLVALVTALTAAFAILVGPAIVLAFLQISLWVCGVRVDK
jgi:hypothetical protein